MWGRRAGGEGKGGGGEGGMEKGADLRCIAHHRLVIKSGQQSLLITFSSTYI